MTQRRLTVLGVTIVDQGFDAALDHLERMLEAPEPRALYFVNAHTLNLAAADPDYRQVLNGADAVFGDGTGVRWAARWRGVRLQANLNGTDLTPALIRRRPGLRVFLLGSAPDRVARVSAGFRRLFPEAELVGAHHGYLDDEASAAVIARIDAARPDLLLVGMGNPIQERWIGRHRHRLTPALTLAVGGLLEYWNGELDRAPGWMRRRGLEWLHLLRRQPWKARRYLLGNPAFIGRLLLWLPLDLKADRGGALG